MVTKLGLYNKALGHLGPARLHPTNGLTENRADRYALDQHYDDVKDEMLEHGIWRFAIRTIEWTADPNIVPTFGVPNGFTLPDDFVRLHLICTDESLTNEDLTFRREGEVYFSNYATLYLSYVSNDITLGYNLGLYTQLYSQAFGLLLANKACVEITKDQNLETKLLRKFESLVLPRAKRKDAIDERVKFKPVGSWVRARFASSRSTRYGGRIT